MELSTVKDAFDRVAKKQKVSSTKSEEILDQINHEIQQALTNIQNQTSLIEQKSILDELKSKFNNISPSKQLEGPQKDLNINLTKYPKTLDKLLNPDISKAYRNMDFDPHILNQIIITHLYREGLFDIADCLVTETGELAESEAVSLKSQFVNLHQILNAMKDKNIEPALAWAVSNREELNRVGSVLELKIHRLRFVEILQNKTQSAALSQSAALKYAKSHFPQFASAHMEEIQKLMGCLLWAGKLNESPYSDLTSPTHYENLTEELTVQFCSFLGQPYNCPLNITMAAGFEGLPTLLKLVNVMAVKKQEWQLMKQLPVPLELRKEFHFHSIFVCPVSRDQSSDENPPMLLPCGHVLCNHSIMKLSKNSTRSFKCPYCPLEASFSQCMQLHL